MYSYEGPPMGPGVLEAWVLEAHRLLEVHAPGPQVLKAHAPWDPHWAPDGAPFPEKLSRLCRESFFRLGKAGGPMGPQIFYL